MKFAKKYICIASSIIIAVSSFGLNAGADTDIDSPLNGDINSDGFIDVFDALELEKFILNSEYNESADVNGDGITDSSDLDELYKYIIDEEHTYKKSEDDGSKIFLTETQTDPGSTSELFLQFDEEITAQAAAVVIEYPESLKPDESSCFENAKIKNFEDGKITAVFTDTEKLDSDLSSLCFKIPDDSGINTIYEIKLNIISFGDAKGNFEKITAVNGLIYTGSIEPSTTEAVTAPVSTENTETSTSVSAVSTAVASSTNLTESSIKSPVRAASLEEDAGISIDVSEIEENEKLQWYKSNEKEFFRDGIKIYIDGKEVSAQNKIYFNTTPESTYNGETFDYVIPFTVEYDDMVIESTFNAKIGQEGDVNLDHTLDDNDINTVISYINYERDLEEFQKYLVDKNYDSEIDYDDISYVSDNVSYILYSDHAEAINCDSSVSSVTIPAAINKLPVTKISGTSFGQRNKLKSIRILNPECEIQNSSNAISINTVIYGYTDSAAYDYALLFNRSFVAIDTLGDANQDGAVNVRDAAFIARKIAERKSSELPMNADFNEDGSVNIRDAAAIARYIVAKY